MRYTLFTFFLAMVFCNCSKKPNCKIYTYTANKFYNGKLDISKVTATVIVTDLDTGIQIQASMTGVDGSLDFPVHIHAESTSAQYGYTGNPVIGIHSIMHHTPTSTTTNKYTFNEFTKNFHGFVVIHDPANVINDTLTHVIFGKIGSW